MKEGSLGAPVRHPIDWQSDEYTNPEAVDAEMRRVLDICHGCRRCFNLCDSFPRLFDLVDNSPTGELDGVKSEDFASVVQACTLCDLCYMTKCPYVPPHEFNLDFPHLMLRYRAMERAEKTSSHIVQDQLSETDRNGCVASAVAPLSNWATARGNNLTRPLMEATLGIHRDAVIPTFHRKTLMKCAAENEKAQRPLINEKAPGFGRKAVIYATCFGNYNDPELGLTAQKILAHNGVETTFVYEGCCGMPKLEQGNVAAVAQSAERIAAALEKWIDEGYDVISPVPSCSLMMKSEWPLILPENQTVKKLSENLQDISEYIVGLSKTVGLVEGLTPLPPVTLHLACHARAQNIGPKAAEMLRLIPDISLTIVERCSGHGGTWGMMKENHEIACKVGRPVIQQVKKAEEADKESLFASECPLAARHIAARVGEGTEAHHPIHLLARSYQL